MFADTVPSHVYRFIFKNIIGRILLYTAGKYCQNVIISNVPNGLIDIFILALKQVLDCLCLSKSQIELGEARRTPFVIYTTKHVFV